MPEDLEEEVDETSRPQQQIHTALSCFISETRFCGPDCMAYMSQPAEVPLDPQQRNCLLLVSVERLARHTAINVKIASDALTFSKAIDAVTKRSQQKPPTPPR